MDIQVKKVKSLYGSNILCNTNIKNSNELSINHLCFCSPRLHTHKNTNKQIKETLITREFLHKGD